MSIQAISSYHGYLGLEFRQLRPTDGPAEPRVTSINQQFRAFVLSNEFPCILAKSVVRRNRYRLVLYDTLGSKADADRNRLDLYQFISEFPLPRQPAKFASFVAVFRSPCFGVELEFENLLWRHLQLMHDEDHRCCAWDPTVSSDPEDPHFSYSVGGRAFFILALHGGASQVARRFGWTTLIFNSHGQFETLRDLGLFESVKEAVRCREVRLQGHSNPMGADYGASSEAIQYAGRVISGQWKCPFHHQKSD